MLAFGLTSEELEQFYKQDFLTHADVLICNLQLLTECSKENISNFKMRRANSYFPKSLPVEEVSFTINNWDKLSSTQKARFTTLETQHLIYFVANGIKSREALPVFIKSCEVAFNKKTAKVECYSIFETDRFKQGIQVGDTYMPANNGDTSLVLSYFFPSATRDAGYNRTINNMVKQMTWAEIIQNLCVLNCSPITYKYSETNHTYLVNLNNVYAQGVSKEATLPRINIFEDYKEYEEGYTEITITYPTLNSAEIIYTTTAVLPTSSNSFNIDKEGYVVSQIDYDATHSVDSFAQTGIKHISYSASGMSLGTYTLTVYGRQLNEYVASQEEGKYNVYCAFLNSTTYASYESSLTQDYETYIECNTMVEFSCRIIPFIEPLDLIQVGNLCTMVVEEITLNFNGGFTGKIKGRKISTLNQYKAPIITRTWYNSDSDYGFSVKNPNNSSLTLYIHYSGGTTQNYAVPANTTVNYSQTYCPELLGSFQEKYMNQDLYDAVYCYFNGSENAVILSDDKTFIAPTISDNIADIDDIEDIQITITNNSTYGGYFRFYQVPAALRIVELYPYFYLYGGESKKLTYNDLINYETFLNRLQNKIDGSLVRNILCGYYSPNIEESNNYIIAITKDS